MDEFILIFRHEGGQKLASPEQMQIWMKQTMDWIGGIEYSPIAALNRTFALSKAKGKQEAIEEAEKLNLADNHFYFMLPGELYMDIDNNKSKTKPPESLFLAMTHTYKQTIKNRIDKL